MRVFCLLAILLLHQGRSNAQFVIPFAFTSEDENTLIKEDDSFKYYVATGDTANTVCIDDEGSVYKLLNKEHKVIAEGNFVTEGDKYLQDGKWTERYGNGRTKRTGNYQKGLPVGTWEEFYSSGKPKRISNYGIFGSKGEINTCLSGSYQEFYSSGALKTNGFYSAELKTVYDTFEVDDPVSGKQVKKLAPRNTLNAVKTGHWQYYLENGDLDKKEDL